MPNPIEVEISVTQEKVPIYVMVDTFAEYRQQALIMCPDGQSFEASGAGEARRIGFWKFHAGNTGKYTFKVFIQHDDGSGLKPSQSVATGSFTCLSLAETVVFSEDLTDNDLNDCLVTFRWFSSGGSDK